MKKVMKVLQTMEKNYKRIHLTEFKKQMIIEGNVPWLRLRRKHLKSEADIELLQSITNLSVKSKWYKHERCPVSWDWRIHQLLLCRGERSVYNIKQSEGDDPVIRELLGNAEYLFIAITPRSTLARSDNTWYGPIYRSNKTKLWTYAKLNCLKQNIFYNETMYI